MQFRTPPVVLNLIILNVIVYLFFGYLGPSIGIYSDFYCAIHNIEPTSVYQHINFWGSLYYPAKGGFFQPYQFVTYMFGHAGLAHIGFNMFALWMFGSQVEMVWGGKKFFIFYFACGIGAAAFNLGIDYLKLQHFIALYQPAAANAQDIMNSIQDILHSSMLGASGAIFGILAAFGMMFPNQMLMLIFPPIPMKAKYMVIGYAALELFYGISNSPGDNVAHFAHLGGGLAGLIMLLYWKWKGKLMWTSL